MDLTEQDLSAAGTVFQIGVPPVRIDIVTSVDGLDFDYAWRTSIRSRFMDQDVPVLSREALIRNKRASGHKQDLADLEWLENQDD
jgi:hypothetical protein